MINFKSQLKYWSSSFLDFIYPEVCLSCGRDLSSYEEKICTICKNELSYTNFEHYQEPSPVDKLFWGRLPLKHTFSLLYYHNNSTAHTILHTLKYKNSPDLARYMGKLIGEHLLENEKYCEIDVLIPIPIHPKKRYIRGYNQSEEIAKGIQSITNQPIDLQLLQRVVHNESQTKKNKFQRWDNVQSVFDVSDCLPENCHHIAIVDDVITTGSTLETAIRLILAKHSVEVSVISIAYAG